MPPNPHDENLRLCWRICRFGVREAREASKRRRVLAWIGRMKPRFPGSPHLERWRELLSGEAPELAAELEGTPDFFTLPLERRGLWRPLIQSQPFTCIVPGRTTRERRAVLSRMP
jgi:hypothetical protein